MERKIPAISITLELDEPAIKKLGYQAPSEEVAHKPIHKKPKFKKYRPRPKEKEDYPFVNNQTELENKVKDRRARKKEEVVVSKDSESNNTSGEPGESIENVKEEVNVEMVDCASKDNIEP